MKTLSESSLNLLRGNAKLTPCQKRKLRKYRAHLRKLADKRVSLTSKKAIVQRGGFFLPLLGAVFANYRQSVIQVVEHNNMLRKMYLVSPDFLSTVTSKNSITSPPPPDKVRKAPKAEKKHTSRKRRRSAKKIKSKKKKDTPQREHFRWVAQRSAARRDYK